MTDFITQELIALGEEPLVDARKRLKADEIYRFVWVPSFRPSIVVRVWRRVGRVEARCVRGRAGPSMSSAIEFSRDNFRELAARAELVFAEARSGVVDAIDAIESDGERWIFEAVGLGGYRIAEGRAREPESISAFAFLLAKASS